MPVAMPRRLAMPAYIRLLIMLCLVLVLTGMLGSLSPSSAWAAEPSTANGTAGSAVADDQQPVSLSIDEGTSTTVDADSGYQATVTITNTGNDALDSGTLKIMTNPQFVFDSSLLMQEWADNGTGGDRELRRLDTVLGSAAVDPIDPGESRTVTVSTAADDTVMEEFTSWGPKPVDIQYDGTTAGTVHVHTFVTRTQDGLDSSTLDTPQLNLVVALPMSSEQWTANTDSITQLLTHGLDGDDDQVSITSSVKDERDNRRALANTLTRHPDIQAVADPDYLRQTTQTSAYAAVMQPSGFDVAFQAQNAQRFAWDEAGLDSSQWNAQTAIDDYHRLVDGDDEDTTDMTAIAWQRREPWTTTALTAAKSQGYDVVVAEDGYEPATPDAVHTSKMVVPTDAGDITVLTAQRDLSDLASGRATSADAPGETSQTGQLLRMVAQTAFYQMERPYESRTLLVSLGSNPDSSAVDDLMSSLEQCGWLHLSSMSDLLSADATITGDAARERADDVQPLSDDSTDAWTSRIDALRESRQTIERFIDDILDTDASSDRTDVTDADLWADALRDAHTQLALATFGGTDGDGAKTAQAARRLANGLLTGVSVAKPDSITIVSQNAKMPITIANDHPYPVRVRFSAQSDSQRITATPDTTTDTAQDGSVLVPANSEIQTTVDVHVLQSGSADITINLLDRNGQPFGSGTNARVTSVFQINDWSGYAILAAAALLGVLGLWRQFHRVKDPDE